MPRRPRLAVEGIPWHIIHRGNNRGACFFTKQDYHYYLATLSEQSRKFDCAIHAFVLMTNHVHLLVTPGKQNSVALMMKNVAQRHTQRLNKIYQRSGTLWDGRFKSCLTQQEAYVMTCYRYIELNPVRASMVGRPEDYPWSSYHMNGVGKELALLTPHPDYLQLGSNSQERTAAYRALIQVHMDVDTLRRIRQATNGNFALGNDRFQSEVAEMLKRRTTPAKNGTPAKTNAL